MCGGRRKGRSHPSRSSTLLSIRAWTMWLLYWFVHVDELRRLIGVHRLRGPEVFGSWFQTEFGRRRSLNNHIQSACSTAWWFGLDRRIQSCGPRGSQTSSGMSLFLSVRRVETCDIREDQIFLETSGISCQNQIKSWSESWLEKTRPWVVCWLLDLNPEGACAIFQLLHPWTFLQRLSWLEENDPLIQHVSHNNQS